MRTCLLILALLLPGCGSTGSLTLPWQPQEKPLKQEATDLAVKATTIKEHAAAGRMVAPEAVQWSLIDAIADEMLRAIERIGGIAAEVGKHEKECAALRQQLAEAKSGERAGQQRILFLFVIGGGAALIAGGVLIWLGNAKVGMAVLAGGGLSVAVGLLLPLLMAVTDAMAIVVFWLIIAAGAALLAVGVWWVWVNRKRLKAQIDSDDATTWENPDGASGGQSQ